jgi:hypothetical protein
VRRAPDQEYPASHDPQSPGDSTTSALTASRHTPAELALVGADDRTDIVVFRAPSASDAARVNTVALDTRTGEILCDCKGAEFGRRCWHADHVVAAWHRTTAKQAARHLSPQGLPNAGRKAARMVGVYRQRVGRPLGDDVLTLVAARSEWRRRAALAAANRAYQPTGATLAALDLPLAA